MMDSRQFLACNIKQYRCIPFNQLHVNMYEGRKDASLPVVLCFGEYLLFFMKLFGFQRALLRSWVKLLLFLNSWA